MWKILHRLLNTPDPGQVNARPEAVIVPNPLHTIDALMDRLSVELPGEARVRNGTIGVRRFKLALEGTRTGVQLWSTQVQLACDDSGRECVVLGTPHVNRALLEADAATVGPTLLRNVAEVASSYNVNIIKATATRNMGRGLTGSGFLPVSWGQLEDRLLEAVSALFPDAIAGTIWDDVRLHGLISVRMFVPQPDVGDPVLPNYQAQYAQDCEALFQDLSWEAELDLNDPSSRTLFVSSMARRGVRAAVLGPLRAIPNAGGV